MLFPVNLPPGVVQTGTESQSTGRFSDSQLIRWTPEGLLAPMGGWQLHSASAAALLGVPRAVLAWKDNSSGRWIAIGSSQRLYVMAEAGAVSDITPVRRSVTLAANPIATTNGSSTITVTDTAHGAIAGDIVTLSGATTTGGLTIGQLNAQFTIVSATTNAWTAVVSGLAATSTATGGGAAVVAKYKITAGRADATAATGYGASTYGTGLYGVARPDTGTRLQPTVWTLDTYGQNLIAVSDSEGGIYQWTLDTATPAAILSNAPTGVASAIVTPERILMALKGRTVSWSDQESNNDWTPTSTNQAGGLDLQTVGTLMCGRPMKGQTFILTTVDAWAAVYQGTPYVYGFNRVGQGCGAISKQCMVVNDTQAIWMGPDGFFAYDGGVTPLPCEVRDAVFGDLNSVQQGKVSAVHLAKFKEVIWFYPSAASTENDRYVKYNYGLNCWDIGILSRTGGAPAGVFDTPLMVTSDGYLYEHETGYAYGGSMPYATTGPFKLGKGDFQMEVQGLIPDELTEGDVNVTFFARTYPNGAETTYGAYALTSPTDFLFQADMVRMKYTGVALTDWRVGQFFLDVIKGDPLR